MADRIGGNRWIDPPPRNGQCKCDGKRPGRELVTPSCERAGAEARVAERGAAVRGPDKHGDEPSGGRRKLEVQRAFESEAVHRLSDPGATPNPTQVPTRCAKTKSTPKHQPAPHWQSRDEEKKPKTPNSIGAQTERGTEPPPLQTARKSRRAAMKGRGGPGGPGKQTHTRKHRDARRAVMRTGSNGAAILQSTATKAGSCGPGKGRQAARHRSARGNGRSRFAGAQTPKVTRPSRAKPNDDWPLKYC